MTWLRRILGTKPASPRPSPSAEPDPALRARLNTIAAKLARLRNLDPGLKVFGSEQHRYALHAPVPEPWVADFETSEGISLPSDYRLFVTVLSAGGAGPHYGLQTRIPRRAGTEMPQGIRKPSSPLREPFPHTRAWNPNANAHDSACSTRLTDDDYFDPKHVAGALVLCHEGCGYETLLVVSGPERGHMWEDARTSDGGILPLCRYAGSSHVPHLPQLYSSHETQRMTFFDWYEWWLDMNLAWIDAATKTQRQHSPGA